MPEICCERKSPKKYFFHISIWCLAWGSSPGFSSNKPTYYLLDYGDFTAFTTKEKRQPSKKEEISKQGKHNTFYFVSILVFVCKSYLFREYFKPWIWMSRGSMILKISMNAYKYHKLWVCIDSTHLFEYSLLNSSLNHATHFFYDI